jgi:hypothetical protein
MSCSMSNKHGKIIGESDNGDTLILDSTWQCLKTFYNLQTAVVLAAVAVAKLINLAIFG